MASRDLDAATVSIRLAALRRLAPPLDPVPGAAPEARDTDMTPEAIARRLDELRALDDLALWLTRGSSA